MFNELYPEALKISLVTSDIFNIPAISLYKTNIKLTKLQKILEHEKKLINEVYNYNIKQEKILGKKNIMN